MFLSPWMLSAAPSFGAAQRVFHFHSGEKASHCSDSVAQSSPLPCGCVFARLALPFLPFSSSLPRPLPPPVNPSAAFRLLLPPHERKSCIIQQETVEGSESPLTPSTIALALPERREEWEEEILNIPTEGANWWWALPLRDFPQTWHLFSLSCLADLGKIIPVQTND